MVMPNAVNARAVRSRLLLDDRSGFLRQLHEELGRFIAAAARKGMRAAVRLDGTSDLGLARTLAEEFSSVQFYDYTKDVDRMRAFLAGQYAPNYYLTFSRSETNGATCLEILRAGGNVAVPFATLPESFGGFPVIDGDVSDWRPSDPRGVIVGLRAKGRARRDASGFVVREGAAM